MAKETEIGKRLKDLIRNSGKTQGDFAAECNVSKDTLTSHFKSENMSVDYLKKYALALGVSTDYLRRKTDLKNLKNWKKTKFRFVK